MGDTRSLAGGRSDEERLPWLEAVEEEEAREGPSAAKLIAFVVIGLIGLGLIVGGLFWLGGQSDVGTAGQPEVIRAPEGDYKVNTFSTGGTFTVDDPEPGVMRVTLTGSYTNAGTVSADLTILSVTESVPQFSAQGKISELESVSFPVNIPSGISKAEFRLSWREGWENVPGNDIDLLIVTPGGSFNFAGATLNSPEQVAINNPVAGAWVVIVSAFKVPTETDKFELRVSLDGKGVK